MFGVGVEGAASGRVGERSRGAGALDKGTAPEDERGRRADWPRLRATQGCVAGLRRNTGLRSAEELCHTCKS